MKLTNVTWLLAVVVGLSTGQLLFKLAARSFADSQSITRGLLSPYLVGGLTLYGLLTIIWIWQLTLIDLARAYPFMALTFVLVPMLSAFALGETTGIYYWLGISFIVIGVGIVHLSG